MVDTENNDEQVLSATETAAAGKVSVCVICNGKSGRPLKGKRCTADKCKREYAALRGQRGDAVSSMGGDSAALRGCGGSAASRAAKVQRLAPVRIQLPRRP